MATIEEQILIEQRVQNDGKSTLVAYLLLIFLGGLGIHRFYLGYVKSGLTMLVCQVVGLTLYLVGFVVIIINFASQIEIFEKFSESAKEEVIYNMIMSGYSVMVIVGILLLMIVGVCAFVDLFLVYGYVKKQHEQLRQVLTKKFI